MISDFEELKVILGDNIQNYVSIDGMVDDFFRTDNECEVVSNGLECDYTNGNRYYWRDE